MKSETPVASIEEDCLRFTSQNVESKNVIGSWKIIDGSHWMFDFENNQQEAAQTFVIIKKYGFTHSCYVGRPNPPMPCHIEKVISMLLP